MAANFTGMNIQEVRTLATQLDASAGEIESIMGRLTGQLGSTSWVGNDRTQFESEWSGAHTTALRNVIEGLRNASAKATQNANEQETASA